MMEWIKKNRVEVLLVLGIILLASSLRFYRISEYMTFLGDEGRDVLVIKRMLVEGDLPFIGPPTSVGNVYLGPLYYYMMAFPMAVFWLNPVAAAGMVAAIGVATVGLVFFLARRWFGTVPAAVSSLLYAVSPVNIVQSRSSWNPNPAPFFALLMILSFDQARRSRNFLWLALSGASLGAAIQMHYLAMILIPVALFLWSYEFWGKDNLPKSHFIGGTVLAIIAFLALMFPLLLFDLKHNFLNYRAITALFSLGDGAINFNLLSSLGRILPIYTSDLIGRYLGGENSWLVFAVALLILFPLGRKFTWPTLALGCWLGIGLVGLSFYRGAIYDHYLGFLNPVPFLLLAAAIALPINLARSHLRKLFQVVVLSLAFILVIINIIQSPILSPPGNQLQKTQEIAKFVIAKSENKPFNFALIAKNNYDAAYQYYLDLYGHKPKVAPVEITDQLFVVCEDEVCNPVGHPKYEIAAFGWAKIEDVATVVGVKVYKLVPNPTGKPAS